MRKNLALGFVNCAAHYTYAAEGPRLVLNTGL